MWNHIVVPLAPLAKGTARSEWERWTERGRADTSDRKQRHEQESTKTQAEWTNLDVEVLDCVLDACAPVRVRNVAGPADHNDRDDTGRGRERAQTSVRRKERSPERGRG